MKFVALVSGGKDSCYNTMEVRCAGVLPAWRACLLCCAAGVAAAVLLFVVGVVLWCCNVVLW